MEETRKLLDEYTASFGLRHSKERYIILYFVLLEKEPFTVSDILASMADERICRAAVYNNISLLFKWGIIEQIPNKSCVIEYKVCDSIRKIIEKEELVH